MTYRTIKRMTRSPDQNHHATDSTSTPGMWQDPGYYQNFNQNMHPTARSPSATYDPYGVRSPGSFDGGAAIPIQPPSEEELVNQQMARLLARPELNLHPSASQSTFRLEWPQGGEGEEETDQFGRRRQRTFDDNGRLLAPNQAKRKRSQSASNAWGKFSRAVGGDRGRAGGDSSGHQRTQSRDDRRREIEMNNFAAS